VFPVEVEVLGKGKKVCSCVGIRASVAAGEKLNLKTSYWGSYKPLLRVLKSLISSRIRKSHPNIFSNEWV